MRAPLATALAIAVLASAACATTSTTEPAPPPLAAPATVDVCAAAPAARVVEDDRVDDATRFVAVEVRGARALVVDGLSVEHVAAAVGHPVLPPGPARDQPSHPQRDLIGDLVASAVLGLIDVVAIPFTVMGTIVTGGAVPVIAFEPPILRASGDVVDDALLDDDEWKAEVRRRAEQYAAAEKARRARVAAHLPLTSSCAGDTCIARAFVRADASSVSVTASRVACEPMRVAVPLPPMTAAVATGAVVDDLDARGSGAARTDEAWTALAAAAPSWADEQPQPRAPDAAFAALSSRASKVGAVDDAALVCRVRAKESFDTIGQADLEVRVAVGYVDVAAHTFRGPDDHDVFTFVVPAVHLAPGDKLKLSVVDIDPFSKDFVGMVSVRYDGTSPIKLEDHAFAGECRVRSHAVETAARASAAKQGTLFLAALARDRATTRSVDVDDDARDRVADIASAGGWSTPEAAAALAAYDALRGNWRARRAAELEQRAVDDVTLSGAAVRVNAPVSCLGSMCTVTFAVRGAAGVHFHPGRALAGAFLVDGLGRRARLDVDDADIALGPASPPAPRSVSEAGVADVPLPPDPAVDVDGDGWRTFTATAWLPSDEAPFAVDVAGRSLVVPR